MGILYLLRKYVFKSKPVEESKVYTKQENAASNNREKNKNEKKKI